MELGKSSLRRNGLNTLKNALHPKHGLAWTDGKSVYLTPAMKNIEKGADPEKHVKLGEFDQVESLSWSHDLGLSCFLCVVQQKTVSIWWVEGSLPNLIFTQTRKINAAALPQGCLWNPYSDVLCILTKTQCSLYNHHLLNKGSFALPPVESGKITCGTWSRNGQKLFIGIGSIVMVYSWGNVDKSFNDYCVTAWKVPELDGNICAMNPMSDTWIMCTAEMPLEALCKQKADLFEVPSVTANKETDIQNNNSTGESSDIITPKPEASPSMTETLFNLQRTEQSEIKDYSQLIVFTIESSVEHPSVVCSTNIQGLLVPDILYFHSDSFHAIVGSNNQSKVHVYNVGEMFKEIVKVDELEVASDEMVKGISACYNKSAAFIILMTGTVTPSDPAFISPSVHKEYDLHLRIFPFPGNIGQTPLRSGSFDSKKINLPNLKTDMTKAKHEKKAKHKDKTGKKTDPQGFDKFLGLFSKSPKGPKIVDLSKNQVEDDELELETVQFDEVSAKFAETIKFSYENLTEEEFNEAVRTCPEDSSSEDEVLVLSGNIDMSLEEKCEVSKDEVAKHSVVSQLSRESRKSSGSLPLLPISHQTDEFDVPVICRSMPNGTSSPRTPRIRLGINSLRSGSRSQSVPSMLDGDIEIPAPDIISTNESQGPELSPDVFFPKSSSSEAQDAPDGMMAKRSPNYGRLENTSHNDEERRDSPKRHHRDNGKHHHHRRSYSYEKEWEDIQKQVKEHGELLSDLHSKIETVLRSVADTSCVPLSGYQDLEEPELVKFNYMYYDDDDSYEQTFLLDRRRVKLDVVLQAFGLTSLEIAIGETAVLVGANIDGYIPIRFTPGSTVQISGQKVGQARPVSNC